MFTLAKTLLWIVGLFYGYGALVHIMNIANLNGFDWVNAPVKWQLLDVFYLTLDIIVAVGFFTQSRIALFAFYIAAISQTFLYTIMRTWVTDVPEVYALSSEQIDYLDYLVIFHIITMILVSLALLKIYHKAGSDNAT